MILASARHGRKARRFCREKRTRRMTPWHRAVFEEAMDLLMRGVPVETLERMIRKGVAK